MTERLQTGRLTWVNLKNPTQSDVDEVIREYEIPNTLCGDLLMPVPRNYAHVSGQVLKIAIDFPVVKRIDKEHPYEVKFMVLPNALITVQYEEMEALDRFKKHLEVTTTLDKTRKKLTGIQLFFGLMNELYMVCSSKLDYIESSLANIETEIFNDNERQMVVEVAKTNKRLIAYRHTLRAHEDVFFELEPLMLSLQKGAHVTDLQSLRKTYHILLHRTNSLFDTLTAIRAANDAMLNTKQNEAIKTLTIMAFITFPLTLVSSMFGMNTERTPIIGHAYDFWIIVSIMCVLTCSYFVFFKYKKWI